MKYLKWCSLICITYQLVIIGFIDCVQATEGASYAVARVDSSSGEASITWSATTTETETLDISSLNRLFKSRIKKGFDSTIVSILGASSPIAKDYCVLLTIISKKGEEKSYQWTLLKLPGSSFKSASLDEINASKTPYKLSFRESDLLGTKKAPKQKKVTQKATTTKTQVAVANNNIEKDTQYRAITAFQGESLLQGMKRMRRGLFYKPKLKKSRSSSSSSSQSLSKKTKHQKDIKIKKIEAIKATVTKMLACEDDIEIDIVAKQNDKTKDQLDFFLPSIETPILTISIHSKKLKDLKNQKFSNKLYKDAIFSIVTDLAFQRYKTSRAVTKAYKKRDLLLNVANWHKNNKIHQGLEEADLLLAKASTERARFDLAYEEIYETLKRNNYKKAYCISQSIKTLNKPGLQLRNKYVSKMEELAAYGASLAPITKEKKYRH